MSSGRSAQPPHHGHDADAVLGSGRVQITRCCVRAITPSPLGTLNNCAHGVTPWGTYLACEENWNGYFGTDDAAWTPTPLEARYGVSARRVRLQLARGRAALRPGAEPQRAQPLRLGRRDRPVRPEVDAGEAHRARPHQARGCDRAPRARAASSSTAATTRTATTSTSSSATRRGARCARMGLSPLDHGTLYVAKFSRRRHRHVAAARARRGPADGRPTAGSTRPTC